MEEFNIVYDNWPDDKKDPLSYNCKKLYPNSIADVINNFDYGIYGSHVNTKNYRLKDIKNFPNKIFNYPVFLHDEYYERLINNEDPFPSEIIKYWKECKNLNIILISPEESERFDSIELLDKWTKSLGLNQKQFWIVNNNKKLYEYKEILKTNINFHITEVLTHHLKKINYDESDFISDKNDYFFMCHNMRAKSHRLLLLAALKKNNILYDVNWSFLKKRDFFISIDYSNFQNIISEDNYKELLPDINYFFNIDKKNSKYEEDLLVEEIDENRKINMDKHKNCFKYSYFNITTETGFELSEDNNHISEKSFKPFYFFQFPIILSTPNHIKYMRKFYDFDFFDDIINHDYDKETDHKKRFNMIIEEIKRINDNKEFFIEFYKNNKDRFIKNHNKVLNISISNNEKEFLEKLGIIKKKEYKMKGLVFAGCSFTWGQGLYYYSGLETLKEPPPDEYHENLVTDAHKRYITSLRYPRLVSNYFNTFEIVSKQNGGSEETSINFLSQIFGLIDSYRNLADEFFDFNEIEYIILQTSQILRDPFNYEYKNENKKFYINESETKYDFYKWLIEEKKCTLEGWLKEHSENIISKIKDTLKFYEEKGIKTKILCWEEDYLEAIKKDIWLYNRFIPLEYNNKTYDCIRYLMNENRELHINSDYDHFETPPKDHHPSLKCHRIIAKNIIDNINKDLINYDINNIPNENIITDDDGPENNYGTRNYIVNR